MRYRLIGVVLLAVLSASPAMLRHGLESPECPSAGEPDFPERVRAHSRHRWRRPRPFRRRQPRPERLLCRGSGQVDGMRCHSGLSQGLPVASPSGC